MTLDADLIHRAQAGDEQAFNLLITAHRDMLFRYAFLLLHDTHEAEDLAQEAVLRIYHHLDKFDRSCPFRPWALSIVANLAKNRYRAFGRYQAMLKRFFQERLIQTSDIETLTHQQKQAQVLHQAVSQLKTEHQQVIYLRYFLELSVEESAMSLNIAEGTVKSRLHRALKDLKAVIEKQYPELSEEQFRA